MPRYANDMTSSAVLDPSSDMKAYVMRTSEVNGINVPRNI